MPVAQHDDGADDAAALVVRGGHDRGLGNGGMGRERGLHLERADPVAGGDDHVVRAALEVEEPVRVGVDAVAGVPRPAGRLGRLGGAGAEIAQEEGRVGGRVEHELAVQHVQPDAGQRPAHRARPGRVAERHARELPGLRLAVAVADPQAGRVVPGAQHARVERLARRHQPAQARRAARRGPLGDHAVLRRRHAQDGDALARDEVEPLVRVEARVVQERGGAAQPRGDERVARRLRPAGRRRAPDQIARPRVEPVLGLQLLAREVALAVQRGLRLARGARGERDQAGSSGASRAGGGGSPAGAAPSHGAHSAGPSQPASPSTARLRSAATTAAGAATARRSRRSLARSCSVHGRTT